jgi:hypothetical protein
MSLRLWIIERYLPPPIRRQMLQQLVRAAADAFGVPPPTMPDAAGHAFVPAFARFTRTAAESLPAGGPQADAVRRRLYDGARGIGRTIRRHAGIRTPEEAVRALRLIYHAIGMDLRTDLATREVMVRRCEFSGHYTPTVCHFVSALDAGLFHGISDRWSVAFDDRITDGAAVCRGRLTEAERP